MKNLLLFLCLFSLLACQFEPKSVAVPDDLKQSLIMGNWRYKLAYIPLEVQAKRFLGKADASAADFEAAMKKVNGHHYLHLSISHRQQSIQEVLRQKVGEQHFPKAWTQFQFHNKEAFELLIGEQLAACVLYHVEQNPLSNKSVKLILVFRDDVPQNQNILFDNDLNFQFKDQILSGETIRITISKIVNS